MQNITDAAIEALGQQAADDWRLEPASHAASLPAAAGPLARILQRPELRSLIAVYGPADSAAGRAQKEYKRLAMTAAVAGFASVTLGGLMLLPPDDALPSALANLVPMIEVVLVAVSFVASLLLALSKPFERWMQERAKAENARVGLFNSVLAADEPARPDELPTLPLQLEYFRRYELDVQRAYYAGRGRQHQRSVTKASLWRVVALLLVGCASLPLVFSILGPEHTPGPMTWLLNLFAKPDESAQRILLCTSVVGGGLQGLLAAYSLLTQSERNAPRYQDAARNLEDLSAEPLTAARAAAAAGDRETVDAYVGIVHDELTAEHREWIALRSLVPDLKLSKLKLARRRPTLTA